MKRWNEIKHSLGFNILFPRFILLVFLPCLILIDLPAPSDIPLFLAVVQPHYVEAVVVGCLLLFGSSVATNMNISRYLRLHQTPSSPYTYEAAYDSSERSSYFRIQVADKAAFRHLLRDLRQERPKKAIQFWLLVEDLLLVPPLLVMGLFAFVFMFLPWLVKFLWGLLKNRKPHPTLQH